MIFGVVVSAGCCDSYAGNSNDKRGHRAVGHFHYADSLGQRAVFHQVLHFGIVDGRVGLRHHRKISL